MACYDYMCSGCGSRVTRYQVKVADCDYQVCECGSVLNRQPTEVKDLPVMDARGNYQPAAIMKDGSTVKGSFGGSGHKQPRGFNARNKV